MNVMSGDMQLALAHDRANRLRAEAASHRRAMLAKSKSPGAMDRMVQVIGQGLVSIGESLKVDRRPRLPAV